MNFERSRRALDLGAILALSLILLYFGVLLPHAYAQAGPAEPENEPRVHIVEDGENLTTIAEKYEVTVGQLQFINHFHNDDILPVGQEVVVPGGDAYPVIILYNAQQGNSIQSIAASFDTSTDDILTTNRTINREYIPARGQPLAIKINSGNDQPASLTGTPYIVQEGETILELSARHNVSTSQLIALNDLPLVAKLYPGQRIRIPGPTPYRDLPGEWAQVEVEPKTIMQGDTVTIYVENLLDGSPDGSFAGQVLNFFPFEEGFIALVGVDAFKPAGSYHLELSGSGEEAWYPFEQALSVVDKAYPNQAITVPEELDELLDPSIRSAEDQFLKSIYGSFSAEKKWEGLFQVPVTDTLITAYYGGGRSYNEGPVNVFHSGVDFNGDIGTPILAAANGSVLFNDSLLLRGNTVIIDHGLGVMTGYYHLSESFVETGQEVEMGQPIGTGGSTGLSTGPHLHWDLQIMGVPVDPLPWTENLFP